MCAFYVNSSYTLYTQNKYKVFIRRFNVHIVKQKKKERKFQKKQQQKRTWLNHTHWMIKYKKKFYICETEHKPYLYVECKIIVFSKYLNKLLPYTKTYKYTQTHTNKTLMSWVILFLSTRMHFVSVFGLIKISEIFKVIIDIIFLIQWHFS